MWKGVCTWALSGVNLAVLVTSAGPLHEMQLGKLGEEFIVSLGGKRTGNP